MALEYKVNAGWLRLQGDGGMPRRCGRTALLSRRSYPKATSRVIIRVNPAMTPMVDRSP